MRFGSGLLIVAALASACARAEPPPPPPVDVGDPPGSGAVVEPADESSPTAKLQLRRVHFEEGTMAVDLVHDVPHSTHAWEVGGVLSQTVALSESRDDVLRILVRAGDGESLDGFRRDHDGPDYAYAPVVHDEICGRPARRVEVSRPELFIDCIEYADGRPSEPGYDPAITIVAQAFEYGDLGVVATWELPTALRERYQVEEERFFASFRCGAAALGERMAGAR